MGPRQPRTAAERAGWASQPSAPAGAYGLVAPLSRGSGGARQRLAAWRALGLAALAAAGAPPRPPW